MVLNNRFKIVSLILLLVNTVVSNTNQKPLEKIIFQCKKAGSLCTTTNVITDGNTICATLNPADNSKFNHFIFNNSVMQDIPLNLFTTFKVLSFKAENSRLPSINVKVFGPTNRANIVKLTSVHLSHNKIIILEDKVFGGATELQTIDLSHNALSVIKETAFYGLKKLNKLDLSNNAIHKLHPELLDELVLLDTILLDHNTIETVPQKFFDQNRALKTVFLNNNKLKAFDSATALKLDLINLANNQFVSFESVNIEATKQNFSNNLLETLNIRKLVKTLELSNNRISKIFVNDANQLTNLTLTSNNISDILFLEQTPNLQALDLSLNRIDLSSFANLPSLTSLKINSIDLTFIDYGMFTNLSCLITLEIAGNALKTFNFNNLIGLNKLDELFMNDNNLTDLDYANVKNVLPNLSKIRIYNNSWNCTYLESMIRSLETQNITIETPPERLLLKSSNVNGIACNLTTNIENYIPSIVRSDWNTNETSSTTNEPISEYRKSVDTRLHDLELSILNIKSILKSDNFNKNGGNETSIIDAKQSAIPHSSSKLDHVLLVVLMLINVAVITIFVSVKLFGCLKKYAFKNQFHRNTKKQKYNNNSVFENSL